jgi:PRTRC genetic system ThiF family protein
MATEFHESTACGSHSATRIDPFWGLGWKGTPQFLEEGVREQTDIVIGCVDSRKARNAILGSPAYWNSHYWLDLGNSASTGQFVLGEPENNKNKRCPRRLPTVAELFPEIVDPKLDRKDKLPSCSSVVALQRQEPFINQTVAYHALALLARLSRYGRLSHHGGFINLSTGRRMSPLPVDPTGWQRIAKRQIAS